MSKFYYTADENGSCYVYQRKNPSPLASRLSRPVAERMVKNLNGGMPGDNARFWAYVNGWVKITLRPGQTLRRHSGGPCEEGYSYTSETWTHNEDHVLYEWTTEAKDCDGRYTDGRTLVCPLVHLTSRKSISEKVPLRPDWKPIGSVHRDHAAEAAGY